LTEDQPFVSTPASVLANDSDVDNPMLTAALVANPAHGALNFHADGTFNYQPDADFNGTDSFTYQASDGSLFSNVATVTLTIAAVNDAPVPSDDAFNVDEDQPFDSTPLGILANDTDVDGPPLTAALVANATHG